MVYVQEYNTSDMKGIVIDLFAKGGLEVTSLIAIIVLAIIAVLVIRAVRGR